MPFSNRDHSSDAAEQAARLRAVLNAAVDAIVTIDDGGKIESVNDAAVRMFGYESAELLGKNVSILMPQPFADEHDSYLRAYLTSGRKKIIGIGREVVGRRLSGEIFPMSLAVGEVELDGRRLFTGIIRDLSEAKAVEAELAKRERQVRFMVENLPAGAMYVDRVERTVMCNKAIARLTGYEQAALTSLDVFFETLFGGSAAEELRKYEARITDGNTDQHVSTIRTAAGQERDIEFTRYRYDHHEVWLAYDRTEELRAAQNIRRERDFVRRLLDTAQAVITIIGAKREIVRCNPAAEEIAGYAEGELAGRDWCDIFCGDCHGHVPGGDLAKALLDGYRVEGTLVTTHRPDGRPCHVLWWGQLLNEAGSSNEVAVLFGQDITDFRHAQDRAVQAERLAAIGQMVTGLAHESRNALQRAQAGLDVLALDVPESQRSLVAKVGAAITHVYRLYDEVRDYAAPIQLQREVIALNTVWERAWRSLQETSTVDVQLDVRVKPELALECDVDPYRIEQVFRNIFENAIAVSQAGDTIVITAARPSPALVEVTVTDRGPGLSVQQKARIFEPFYTTKQRGTGLGMAIVARIMEEHGGQIRVTDAHPNGAAVTVALPVRRFES